MKEYFSADYAHSRLSYRPDTGQFIWKLIEPINKHAKRWNTRYAGTLAGYVNHKHDGGYWIISVDGESYAAHRLAWLMTTGAWPTDQIDHINGQKLDNRFANLREATSSQNCMNIPMRKDNTSGYRGIDFRRGKWRARIRVDNKQIHIGEFSKLELAIAAYDSASRELHGEFARQV